MVEPPRTSVGGPPMVW